MSEYAVEDKKFEAPFDPAAFIQDEEEEIQELIDSPCLVCAENDDEDVLLLCDGCDSAYHTYCLNLDRVPSGLWYCVECADSEDIEEIINEGRPAQNAPRTVGTVRRDYRRGRTDRWYRWSGAWGHFSSQVHNASGVDLDFSDDDPAMADFRQLMRRTGDLSREMEQRARRTANITRRNSSHGADPPGALRVASRAGTPQFPAQTVEEALAWEALEEAQQLTESSPRGRKRKAETEPDDQPEPSTEPERRLKRPRTRRVMDNVGPVAGPSTTTSNPAPNSISSHPATPIATTNTSEPSFLTALLREVEVPATSDDDTTWSYNSTINRHGNNGSPTQYSSPASSPSPPPYQRGRATSMTPPPGTVRRTGSPIPLTSRVEPVSHRARFTMDMVHNTEDNMTSPPTAERRQPRLRRPQPAPLARSPEASPVRETMSIEAKAAINKLVKGALAPHWKSAEITPEQYADINRDVSRKLYEEIGDLSTSDEQERWERMAARGVESALKDMKT